MPVARDAWTLARLHQALRTARIGTWSFSVRDNALDWDDSLLSLIGFHHDGGPPPNAEHLLEFVHPDDRSALFADTMRAVERGEALSSEFRIVHGDGTTRWLLTRAELIHAPDRSLLQLLGACTDITARKLVEARLQRVIRTLKAARVATFFWDAVASTVAWEDEARFCFPSVSGVAADVDIAFVLERVHVEERARVRAAFEAAAGSGETLRLTCMAAPDNVSGATWLEAVVVGSADALDGWETLAGAFVDVSDHRELEREASDAKRTLQLALSAGEIGTQVWDIGTGGTKSDGVWNRLIGSELSKEADSARRFEMFIQRVDPRDRTMLTESFARLMSNHANERAIFRYTRFDGATLWLSASSRTEFDKHGKPLRLVTAVADFTELKRAEQRLLTQSEVSSTLARIDSVPEALHAVVHLVRSAELLTCGGVWLVDEREHVLRCVGFDTDESLATSALLDACRTDVTPPGSTVLGRIWRQPSSVEVTLTRPDTLRALIETEGLVPIWLAPVQSDAQCIGVLGFYARAGRVQDDVTSLMHFVSEQLASFVRRRTAEQALRTLNIELEQRVTERTKELESFSYSVSHDLRSPLRTLDGFSQALTVEYGTFIPEEGHHLLREIRAGALRMGELIDDLLNFSRLGRAPLRKRPFSMSDLVAECLTTLAPSHADRAVAIRVDALPDVEGDRALLRQVWTNLLSNAIKYSSKNPQSEISVSTEQVNGVVVYIVKDNGAGFDMRYVHKLFGVFRRLHRAEDYEGTGVGLAIVQRIVQRHGGRIWAEAAPGRGATFSFTLTPETLP